MTHPHRTSHAGDAGTGRHRATTPAPATPAPAPVCTGCARCDDQRALRLAITVTALVAVTAIGAMAVIAA